MSDGKPGAELVVVLEQLRERVRQRRERLMTASARDGQGLGFSLAELRHSIKELGDLSTVSAHLPITSYGRPLGWPGAIIKRIARVLLRWYINPIVEQQNNYNAAVSRAVFQVMAYEDLLTREQEALERRLDELESALAESTGRPNAGGE
jgi:hypothetical protein